MNKLRQAEGWPVWMPEPKSPGLYISCESPREPRFDLPSYWCLDPGTLPKTRWEVQPDRFGIFKPV